MNETINVMPLDEYENGNGDVPPCKEIDAPCHPEFCRKFKVFVPFTVTPFGRPDEEHITIECGDFECLDGNPCQGSGHTSHDFTVSQIIKVMIPVKFGADVCTHESCNDDLRCCDEDDPVEVTHVTMSHSSVNMRRLQTYQLTATVHPENATVKTLTWESSDTRYATVTQNGLVTSTSNVGQTRITATTPCGKFAYCDVEVNYY